MVFEYNSLFEVENSLTVLGKKSGCDYSVAEGIFGRFNIEVS